MPRRDGDAVSSQMRDDLLATRSGHHSPLHRQHLDRLGGFQQRHRQRDGARRLGAAVPGDDDRSADLARRGPGRQQHRASALERRRLAGDHPSIGRRDRRTPHGDEIEDPPLLGDQFAFQAIGLPPARARSRDGGRVAVERYAEALDGGPEAGARAVGPAFVLILLPGDVVGRNRDLAGGDDARRLAHEQSRDMAGRATGDGRRRRQRGLGDLVVVEHQQN